MIRNIIVLAAMALACLLAQAQRTTRPGLKPMPRKESADMAIAMDTIALDTANVRLSGYEKTLRSTVESVFITNNTDTMLSSLTIIIQYLDMQGRQLHTRQVTIDTTVPAGETRLGRFSSWDKQKVWYYYLSDPVRTRMQSTPYKVSITPVKALASKPLERAYGVDK